MTTRITSNQQKQLERFTQDAINRALNDIKPDKDGVQRLIERGGEFQNYIVAGISRFTSKLPDYTLARLVLGTDFISADEIATARGLAYTEDQLVELGRKLPDQATLEALCDNDMILVAGPPTSMNMRDIRAVHSNFFEPEQDYSAWYNKTNEKFTRTDRVKALTWIAFLKEPIRDSLNKTWSVQKALVAEPMTILNIAETTWVMTTYKAVRDIYLLNEFHVRTSSLGSDGRNVDVGYFGDWGIEIYSKLDNFRDSSLGISSGRKF